MPTNVNWSLVLVTDRTLSKERALLDIVSAAIDGGITALQLREKQCSTREFIESAEKLQVLTSNAKIPFIINDRVDIAKAVGADGVHLGQDDLPYQKARDFLGPNALIGLTVSNAEEAKATADMDLAYVGAGPVFSTTTKEKAKDPIGISGLQAIVEATVHPVVAIGGIKVGSVASLMEAGVSGIAVVSAITEAEHPRDAARKLYDELQEGRNQLRLIR